MVQQYWIILRRWLWLLLLTPLVASATAYILNQGQPANYQASTRLMIGPGMDSADPDINDLRTASLLMNKYAELATTRSVLQELIQKLQLDFSTSQLKQTLEIKTNQDTQILSIIVSGVTGEQAVDIANTLAEILVQMSPSGASGDNNEFRALVQTQIGQTNKDANNIEATIKQMEAQLPNIIDAEQKGTLIEQLSHERTLLAEVRRTLAVLYESVQKNNTNQVKVVEWADGAFAVDSNLSLLIMMAGAAGLMVSIILVFAIEYFDDSIKTAEDLIRVINIPLLAIIAKQKRLHGVGRERLIVQAAPESRAAESYRVLGSKILLSRYRKKTAETRSSSEGKSTLDQEGDTLQVENNLRSILISSTQISENANEVAANLAVILAQTGQRVILVDACLYSPVIHQIFGINGQNGLANTLMMRILSPKANRKGGENEQKLPEAFSTRQLLIPVDWMPNLQILPGGTSPSNPFELLVSSHMDDLIKSLEQQADIVIIAAAPLLSFADSLISASRVDGVVIVAQHGQTRRDKVKAIIESLHSLNANILGVVFDHNQQGNSLAVVNKKRTGKTTNQSDKSSLETPASSINPIFKGSD